jgi:FkbM family methyltransferase
VSGTQGLSRLRARRAMLAREYRRGGLVGLMGAAARRARMVRGAAPKAERGPIQGVLEWLGTREAFTIVQIGAYVGDSANDPLSPFLHAQSSRDGRSLALLVEPVRPYFEELRRNYSGLRFVRFENVAVAEETGVRDFYRLAVDPAEHGFPDWLSQLGSLRADRMTHLWDAHEREPAMRDFYLAHRIVERVECVTFHALLERHGIGDLDLLQMDAEGYDYEILRTLDFGRVRPRFVNYERELLGPEEAACRALMREAGYVLFDSGKDTLAVRVD